MIIILLRYFPNVVCSLFFCICQWTQLKTRKQNLTRLFQKMQSYQFEQISADPDKPLADGIRPLDTADMERYVGQHQKNKYIFCSLFLQIQDIRNHFSGEMVLFTHCPSSVRFLYIFWFVGWKMYKPLKNWGMFTTISCYTTAETFPRCRTPQKPIRKGSRRLKKSQKMVRWGMNRWSRFLNLILPVIALFYL